jgi:hypothetical protein
VERNYTLESDLLESQAQVAAILTQHKMLQDQVAVKQVDHKETGSEACGNDNEEGPSLIRGGYDPCSTSKGIQQELTRGEGYDFHNGHKIAMLEGIWPGNDGKDLLARFITTHFDNCANSYFPFIRWLQKIWSTNPMAMCSVNQWLWVNTKEQGGPWQLEI